MYRLRGKAHRSRQRGAWNRADLCEAGLKTYELLLNAMNNHEPELTETNATATDLMLSIYDSFSGSYLGEMALS